MALPRLHDANQWLTAATQFARRSEPIAMDIAEVANARRILECCYECQAALGQGDAAYAALIDGGAKELRDAEDGGSEVDEAVVEDGDDSGRASESGATDPGGGVGGGSVAANTARVKAMADNAEERATIKKARVAAANDTDATWAVVDMYKRAVQLASEGHDLEGEAMACARLGRLYRRLLNIPDRADTYYREAVDLATSLAPRTFTNCRWYKNATAMVALRAAELRAINNRDNALRAEVADTLKDVAAASVDGAVALLRYVYTNHPPKAPGAVLGDLGNPKRALRSAVTHYHPDKNSGYGIKWELLAAGITAELNQHYDVYKGR